MQEAFICDYIRTPIGRYGGGLSSVRPDDLAAHALRALAERNPHLNLDEINDVVFGCANQAGEDNRNVARMSLLLAGYPVSVPGTTINRLCGSGLDAVGTAARAIRSGDTELMIAGGVESMSRAPFVLPKARQAFSRDNEIHDTTIGWRFVNKNMKAQHGVDSMPETAENVAEEFDVSRADQDLFAWRSQQKYAIAKTAGFFLRETVPIRVVSRKIDILVEHDEHPRPDTTVEGLAKLKTPFRNPGTVTAGNASGVNDGAAALIVANEATAARQKLTTRARIVAMAASGVSPRIMGMGPLSATQKLLSKTGFKIGEIDVIELNEAFASQALAVIRRLGLADDDPRVNPHGGAIAIGHPLGCSGARLVMTALNALETKGGKRAIITMCIGVGQGIAMLIETV